MPASSQLAITTSAVQRLVKEEASYHKELEKQKASLEKMQASSEEDENREYTLKQQKTAIEETKKVFPPLHERIADAVAKLKHQVSEQESGDASPEEISKAQDAIKSAEGILKPVH